MSEFLNDRRKFLLGSAGLVSGSVLLGTASDTVQATEQTQAAEANGKAGVGSADVKGPSASYQWFSNARFGIFIHWGLYSLHGRDVWSMYTEQTPVDEYRKLADRFNPKYFDADEWASIAKDAGARYMVMCTRQHDGFSLFDSRVSEFTSVKSGARRDFVKEYAEAARRAGLGVGFYYSLLDWRIPAYFKGPKKVPDQWNAFVAYVHAQVRELCTNYGKIDILWFDAAWPYTSEDWRTNELFTMVRSLQPAILINDGAGEPGDFDTRSVQTIKPVARTWEASMTMNDHWGYCPADDNWKDTKRLISYLVRCASRNGNFLLNVGPDAHGRFPKPSIKKLQELGRWLRAHGDSIYGTDDILNMKLWPEIGQPGSWPTVRGNELFVHLLHWPGEEYILGNMGNRISSVRFLDGNRPITFRQDGSRVFLSDLPAHAPDRNDTVLVLECEGKPRGLNRFA